MKPVTAAMVLFLAANKTGIQDDHVRKHLDSLICLTINVYNEARGTSFEDKLAVANVVLNRVKSKKFPNNVCTVIRQPRQFSWYRGKMHFNVKNRIEKRAFIESALASLLAFFGKKNPVGDAMWYHNLKIRPPVWTKKLKKVKKTDGHVYYTLPKRKR